MNKSYDWEFPLPRTHTGVLQANGTFGAMIWGGDNVLKITINRADFWDYRGGLPWTAAMNFKSIRTFLETNDETGLRALFETPKVPPGTPVRPSALPLGRLELTFEPEARLTSATLRLADGHLIVRITKDGEEQEVGIDLSMNAPSMTIELPAALAQPAVKCVTAWDYVGEHLRSIQFAEPDIFQDAKTSGWVQTRPAGTPLCVGYSIDKSTLRLAVEYGSDANAAKKAVGQLLADPADVCAENKIWWNEYWAKVPKLSIPNPRLTFLYDYGMYKFAGLTNPAGVPATLQSAWVEEYQMPPWSSDYHFNINVQMCYWPAYQGNLLEHLRPLFDMVWSWKENLREHARLFLGINDGLMLPHAVDGECTNMGGYWTGTIDHGCTAWVGKMMYDYWLYGGDQKFLAEVAYPFMVGAMRVYEAMLEAKDTPEGKTFSLPISVSPEYRGAAMNAWGKNASFQLACIHWLVEALQNASKVLNKAPKPIWQEIQNGLPRASLFGEKRQQIALWDGTPLEESHRHHSHMAGIYPFDTIDLTDEKWRLIVHQTLGTWIREGMGLWSGWCVPWAAMLQARGHPEAAELLLEIWERVFTNEGHGTLHDVQFPGISHMGGRIMNIPPTPRNEIMQIEAGMAATAAILDFLVQTRRGVTYLFSGAPKTWRDVEFQDIRIEGAFLISAHRRSGKVESIRIRSERGGTIRLKSPWNDSIIEIEMKPNSVRDIVPQ